MLIKKLLLATAAALTLGGFASAAQARTDVGVYFNFAPPVAYYEPVPVARVGYVWVPGFWDVRFNRHYWVAGHWERYRPGHIYYPARWVSHGSQWRLDRGYWGRGGYRDRDHDGIPDYRDRFVGHYRNYR